jgi:signal transduction histidine kinase
LTKTFGRIFRVQVLIILVSNLLFSVIFLSFAFRLYKQALASDTDKAADNLVYLVKQKSQLYEPLFDEERDEYRLRRFFPRIKTFRSSNDRGELLYHFGDRSLDKADFPRRLFDSSVRSFRYGEDLLIMEVFPYIMPGGEGSEPSYWIWTNVKRTGLILLGEMIFALVFAFFLSSFLSRDSKRLSASLLRLADGHWEEDIPDGTIEENRTIAEAVRILQYRLIRQRKMILRRLQELTHDLKSPISGVYTQIEAIELGSLPLTEERFSRIYGELKYLNGLIDDMAEFYRLEDDALPIRIDSISCDTFLDTLMLRFEPLAHKAKKTLLSRRALDSFNGDSELLYRAVGNMLSNAISHGEGRGISLEIRGEGDHVLIAVENEGMIPEQDLARLMSRYWSRRKNGSGLGLTIADLIAQKHRGALTIRNTDVDTTICTISLPLS